MAGDILDYADFFLPDDRLPYDDKAFDKHIRKPPEAEACCGSSRSVVAATEPFDAATLEQLGAGVRRGRGNQGRAGQSRRCAWP